MRSIITRIDINAEPARVWQILTDFERYPEWNPFIRQLEGDVREGGRFKVVIQPQGGKPMTFTPRCLAFEEDRHFRWLGQMWMPGIFDGEHIFELRSNHSGGTHFIHRENFKGVLVPLLWKQLDNGTRKGFERMNAMLKSRAETAEHTVHA